MIDTTNKELLKLSICDFYDFITNSNNYQKYSLNEIKGILYNKLLARFRCSDFNNDWWQFKKCFSNDNISIEIKEGKLTKLSFVVLNESNKRQKDFITAINTELETINLEDIYNQYNNNYKDFIPQTEQIINKLNNFKIPTWNSK
jgi:hypothetical protein